MTTILIVDDNATNRKLVAAQLGFEGYEIVEAVDGVDGLAKAQGVVLDLVISDILMPSMDGYEFVRRLRISAEHRRTPVIFYTAHYNEIEARSLANRVGVAKVIVKPCESAVLLAAVGEVLKSGSQAIAPEAPEDVGFDVEHLRTLTNKLANTATELRAEKARADALVDLNAEIVAERDSTKLLDSVCRGARLLLAAKFAVLAVSDPGTGVVQHVATSGIDFGNAGAPIPSMSSGLLSRVFRSGKTLRIVRDADDLIFPPGYPRCEQVLAVPVASRTRTYGWLCVTDKVGGTAFSVDDERVLRTLGGQVGTVYENGTLYEKAQSYAAHLLVQMEERDRAAAGLRASEELFRQIADNVHDALFIVETATPRTLYVSPAYERIWGHPGANLLRDPNAWIGPVHADDKARVIAESQSFADGGPNPGELEFRIVRDDGSIRWISARIFPIVDNAGRVWRLAGISRDITESRLAAQKIEHLSRVHSMLSGINSLIVRATARADLLPAACRLAVEHGRFGIAWCGMLDQASGDLVAAAYAGEMIDAAPNLRVRSGESDSMAMAAIRTCRPVICNDLRDARALARNREELVRRGMRSAVALPLVIADASIGCVILITDEVDFFNDEEMKLLSEFSGDIAFALDHIAKADRLNYLAYYDALTGLANRTLFQERVAQQISAAQRAGTQLGIVIADLERFDSYNETFGRTVADQLLRTLAARFAECVGGADLAGRVGADHFAAIVLAKDATDVGRAIEELRRRWLGEPFEIGGQRASVAAKAGMAMFPTDGHDAEALLHNAETALRNAKQTGKPDSFYAPNLSERIAERLTLEKTLRSALEKEEFVLYYQPKVDLERRRVCGVEALLRWQSPELGLVPPGKFIPLLEESGLIVEVGDWVLRQASLDRSQWLERGFDVPRVAVNVSPLQLQRDDFVRKVSRVLRLAGSEAGIDIEVTESVLMTDVTDNLEKLTALRALGVGIALDDFGTGYSSLAYLAKLPVQTLKIDRSFVAAMLDDPGAMTLVSTIISLAAALRLETVAEGVESEEQAKILRLLRCGQMQGFLISAPLSFDDATVFLGRKR